MDRSGTRDVTKLLARQFQVARDTLRFHELPKGITLRDRDRKVWSYDSETQTLHTDLLLSGKILAPKVPVRMEVGFVKDTDRVKSVSMKMISPDDGMAFGTQIGTSPMTTGGAFRTDFRGAPVQVDWDHSLQTVYYFANRYADKSDPSEVEALRRLHAFGSVHGRALVTTVPGVSCLLDIDASGMIGEDAGPDTEFGRALQTCVAMASRFEPIVSRDHYKAVTASANLWARHGEAIEARFVFEPKVIPFDFKRRSQDPEPDEAVAEELVVPRF